MTLDICCSDTSLQGNLTDINRNHNFKVYHTYKNKELKSTSWSVRYYGIAYHEKFYNYRSGMINLNMVNSKFHLIQSFFEFFCQVPIISCLKCTVNLNMVYSNMVISKFHKFKVNLTVVWFKVSVIWSIISKFVVIQSNSKFLLWNCQCNLNTLY